VGIPLRLPSGVGVLLPETPPDNHPNAQSELTAKKKEPKRRNKGGNTERTRGDSGAQWVKHWGGGDHKGIFGVQVNTRTDGGKESRKRVGKNNCVCVYPGSQLGGWGVLLATLLWLLACLGFVHRKGCNWDPWGYSWFLVRMSKFVNIKTRQCFPLFKRVLSTPWLVGEKMEPNKKGEQSGNRPCRDPV